MINENIRNNYRAHRATFCRASIALEKARELTARNSTLSTHDAPTIGSTFDNGLRYVSNWSAYFRDMKYADDVVRSIQHKGWYCDTYQDATYRGAIFQLPGRDGNAQWLAGYIDSNNDDAAVVRFTEVFDVEPSGAYDDGDLRDAAMRADRIAETQAEDAREYDTAWQAGSMWRQEMERLPAIRKEFRELHLAYAMSPAGKAQACILDAIRAQLRERHEALDNAERYAAGNDKEFYFYPSETLRAAFNDGAGEKVL